MGHGQQPQLEQQGGPEEPPEISRSSAQLYECAAAEHRTPAIGALQMDSGNAVAEEEPALQDHQVAHVSSGGASQGTKGPGARPIYSKGTNESEPEPHEGTFIYLTRSGFKDGQQTLNLTGSHVVLI